MKDLLKLSNDFLKIANTGDVFVYTFVPKEGLNIIKDIGILSSALVVENKKVLNLIRPDKKSRDKFINSVKDDLNNEENAFFANSVSVFFTLPDFEKMSLNHFIFKRNLVPLRINLSHMCKDDKNIKMYAVELKKFNDSLSDLQNNKRREKYFTLDEVKKYTEKSPSELWKDYNPKDLKHYAADVPHLLIETSSKCIKPKYIEL